MSHVDNWLLLPGIQLVMDGEDDTFTAVARLNHALAAADPGRGQTFRELSRESWGGQKYPETPVFGLAANHLAESVVLDAVAGAGWPEPWLGLLCLMRQHDEAWTVFRLDDLVAARSRR